MGLRFRKSIKIGAGFKINLSKSGVGYSWGVKGYRVTKKAGGGTRKTASIPGTGISYVSDSKKGIKSQNTHNSHEIIEQDNIYDTVEIKNNKVESVASAGLEEIIDSANKALLLNRLSTIGIAISIIISFFCLIYLNSNLGISKIALIVVLALTLASLVAFLIWKICIHKLGRINLEYAVDDELRKTIDERMLPLKKIMSSDGLWYISQTSKVIDKKYAAGANTSVKRLSCNAKSKLPFPLKSNEETVCFICGKERLIFLPDKFFIIKKNKLGALDYSDLITTATAARYVERERVPSDAKIIDRTWEYVNKSGGPDSRFKNNKELPICFYGELNIKSNNGAVNIILVFSNTDIE